MTETREGGNNNKKIRILRISESLKDENIVGVFAANDRCIHATLNHVYKDTTIISDIDKKSWQKTVKNFREAAEKKGVEQKHIDMLDNTLADNYQTIDEISRERENTNNCEGYDGEDPENGKQKYVYPVYKYSNNRKGPLHEAVILSGLPRFITYDKETGELVPVERIEEPSRFLRPPNAEEYPYEPYEFANPEELENYLNRVKEESIHSLYQKWTSIVNKYNDQDEYKQILITMDLVWTYFQDLFPTTHYVAAIGDNGSGKSSIGETFEYGAYKCVNLTNPSAPNVFRILGTIESGQCTMILDEADRIEESSDMQGILKTGFRYGKRVPKTNTNSWKLEYFFTYCFKVFLAESSPSLWKSKGVLDRTLTFTTYTGDPIRLIEETTDPQGDPERQRLLDELNDLRKLMLMYRLVHFADPIADIDIGIKGRNMQLTKPYIQLFYNTPVQRKIEQTLQRFLSVKNEKRSNSIEAILLPIIRKLLSEDTRKDDTRVPISRIWERIKTDIGGENSSKDPNECYTDYGNLYRTKITKIICDKFGAEGKRSHGGKRVLEFNLDKLKKLEKAYGAQTEIITTLKKDGNDDDANNGKGNESQQDHGDKGDGIDNSTGLPTSLDIGNDESTDENFSTTVENVKDIHECNESSSKEEVSASPDVVEKKGGVLQQPSEPSPLSPEKSEQKFWSIYNYLLRKEQQNPSNHMTIDRDTVSGSELVSALYDSGQFSRTKSNEFISNAVKSGKLEEVLYDTYRKRA